MEKPDKTRQKINVVFYKKNLFLFLTSYRNVTLISKLA